MSPEQAADAIRLLVKGKMTLKQIAARVDCSLMSIQQIAYGASWCWMSGFMSQKERGALGGKIKWDDPQWTGWDHKTVQPGPEAKARMSKTSRRGTNPFI